MITVDVESDVRSLTRALTSIQTKQIPYATARAVQDTAYRTQQFIIRYVYPKSFIVRNRVFPRTAFQVRPRRVPKSKPEAVIYDRLGKEFLKLQTSGGTKTPFTSRYLKVPPRGDQSVYTSRGKLRRFPRTIVLRKNGRPAIYQQQGGKRNRRLKYRYALRQSVNIQKRFPFYEMGIRHVRETFPVSFKRSLAQALRTAR